LWRGKTIRVLTAMGILSALAYALNTHSTFFRLFRWTQSPPPSLPATGLIAGAPDAAPSSQPPSSATTAPLAETPPVLANGTPSVDQVELAQQTLARGGFAAFVQGLRLVGRTEPLWPRHRPIFCGL
jgi:hypothetical protein